MLTTAGFIVGSIAVYLLVAVISERYSPLVGIGGLMLILMLLSALS